MMKKYRQIKECAETSQSVKSLNDQQNVRLKKMIRHFERSKTSTINSITSNQKQTMRNFQNKIFKSKLFYARMWEDRAMERNLLRERYEEGHLGSDSSHLDRVLKLLLQKGSASNKTECSALSSYPKCYNFTEDDIIEAVSMEQQYSYHDLISSIHHASPTEISDNEGHALPSIHATNMDHRLQNGDFRHLSPNYSFHYIIPVKGESSDTQRLQGIYEQGVQKLDRESLMHDREAVHGRHIKSIQAHVHSAARPKTCSGVPTGNEEYPKSREILTSNRRHSMFNKSVKYTRIEKLLLESKEVTFEPRIRQFCESLKSLKCREHSCSETILTL